MNIIKHFSNQNSLFDCDYDGHSLILYQDNQLIFQQNDFQNILLIESKILKAKVHNHLVLVAYQKQGSLVIFCANNQVEIFTSNTKGNEFIDFFINENDQQIIIFLKHFILIVNQNSLSLQKKILMPVNQIIKQAVKILNLFNNQCTFNNWYYVQINDSWNQIISENLRQIPETNNTHSLSYCDQLVKFNLEQGQLKFAINGQNGEISNNVEKFTCFQLRINDLSNELSDQYSSFGIIYFLNNQQKECCIYIHLGPNKPFKIRQRIVAADFKAFLNYDVFIADKITAELKIVDLLHGTSSTIEIFAQNTNNIQDTLRKAGSNIFQPSLALNPHYEQLLSQFNDWEISDKDKILESILQQDRQDILKLLVTRIKKNNLLEKYYLVLPEELGELLVGMIQNKLKKKDEPKELIKMADQIDEILNVILIRFNCEMALDEEVFLKQQELIKLQIEQVRKIKQISLILKLFNKNKNMEKIFLDQYYDVILMNEADTIIKKMLKIGQKQLEVEYQNQMDNLIEQLLQFTPNQQLCIIGYVFMAHAENDEEKRKTYKKLFKKKLGCSSKLYLFINMFYKIDNIVQPDDINSIDDKLKFLTVNSFEELEELKLDFADKLLQLKQNDLAFNMFQLAQIDVNLKIHHNLIISLYLRLGQFINCYHFVSSQASNDCFNTFIEQSIEYQKQLDLFKLELEPAQEAYLQEFFFRHQQKYEYISHVVQFLLNRKQFEQAIQYFQNFNSLITQQNSKEFKRITKQIQQVIETFPEMQYKYFIGKYQFLGKIQEELDAETNEIISLFYP